MIADQGISEPPPELHSSPSVSMPEGRVLYRSVSIGRDPWWFGASGTQRFDLSSPRGTCYLATDIETSLREKTRSDTLAGNFINAETAALIEVHCLRLPTQTRIANLCTRRAVTFGASRELSSVTDYALSGRWAEAFSASGFEGIAYGSRFTSDPAWNAVALFGAAGDAGWESSEVIGIAEAAARAGLRIEPVPGLRAIDIVDPPRN